MKVFDMIDNLSYHGRLVMAMAYAVDHTNNGKQSPDGVLHTVELYVKDGTFSTGDLFSFMLVTDEEIELIKKLLVLCDMSLYEWYTTEGRDLMGRNTEDNV